MLSLKGKGVCGGVTLGTLAVLRRNTAAVKRCKVQNAEAEVARFQTARQDAIDKLAELYEKAVADVGKDNAAIFEIHQMMLEDLDYIESVEGIIARSRLMRNMQCRQRQPTLLKFFLRWKMIICVRVLPTSRIFPTRCLAVWVMAAAVGKAAAAVTFWQRMTWHPAKLCSLINRVYRDS